MAKDDDSIGSLKATRLLAFRAVSKKDPEYVFRHIMRWFSREFHTPLSQVEEMPVEDILQHFFECRYEGMDEHDLEEEASELLMTAAERKAKEEAEAQALADDEEFAREAEQEAAEQATNNPEGSSPARALEDIEPAMPVSIMGENLPTTFKELADKAEPGIKTIPPEVKMIFVDDDSLDDMDAWDIMGAPKKKEEK